MFFNWGSSSTLVAMATYGFGFHWLTMGKVKIGIYCYLIADIWQKCYRNCCWVVLHQTKYIILVQTTWLVAIATKRLNLWKKYSKINSSEAVRGTKLKLCNSLTNIVFYCSCWTTLVAILTLNFSNTYNGEKVKIGIKLLTCSEMFFE